MKRNNIVLMSLVICLFSCNKKQDDSLYGKVKIKEKTFKQYDIEIEKILERQLRAGGYSNYYDTDYAYYKYDKSDLEITFIPIKKILIKNGYKISDKDTFLNRIKSIFGNISRYDDIFYMNSSDKCFKPKSVEYYDPEGFRNDLYVSIENQIILNLFSLPEIIDYQKDYKEIASKEDKFPTEIVMDGETEKIYLTMWKDIKDLAKKRNKNVEILINRNKYLFNDNKASLVWLKFNDEYFLESLVKVFGYVEDKDLLKWVLDRSLNDDEFDKILVTKNCDNKYIFHKEVFEVIAQANTESKKKYFDFLKEHFPKIDDLSFSEDTKIKALYCYYATSLDKNNSTSSFYSFFPKLDDEKYEEEFKRNNYYNLPDFKELYNYARRGGIGLPM